MAMDGNLWKWTNYFSGWQPRWFVLDNGILSYYRSQEDVVNGCKGSIKMSVCDVAVHQTDNTRLDLSIPGEAHFYVKAATPQERQEWLIALGTCKAGQHHSTAPTISTTAEIPEEQLKSKKSELRLYCDLLMQQVHSVKTAVKEKANPDIQELNEASSLLSATCDTFINTLDECVSLVNMPMSPTTPTSPAPPTPTKSMRISPLKSYANAVQKSISLDSSTAHGDEDGIVRGYIPQQFRSQRKSSSNRSRNNSDSSASPSRHSPSHSRPKVTPLLENGDLSMSHSESNLLLPVPIEGGQGRSHSLPTTPNSSQTFRDSLRNIPPLESTSILESEQKPQQASHIVNSDNRVNKPENDFDYSYNNSNTATTNGYTSLLSISTSNDIAGTGDNTGILGSLSARSSVNTGLSSGRAEDSVRDAIVTFFSSMEVSFQDLKLFEDGGVPTTQFLSACREVLPVFDKLNPTAFAPIKMEFTGNVRKIHQKYSTDPDQFITLQNIVLFEMKKGQHINANSATVALLWLKRGLEFIREFLLEYMTGLQDLTQASNQAYCRSLKPFHSYVVRGVFALAAKSAPTRELFTQSLASNPFHTKRANFEQVLLRDIEAYVTANDVILKILNDFYTQYHLNSREQM